ncbi:alcohol acetyltransferase [Marinilactibacillus kalidii]|uniref:alcohol acetyltransferase n=1 Tax=Marinilactibacillus kalidii TaxID=2820274 RepID=UPI001ABE7680|nr:alcohol acetyltransferase [Marinilactibacillus kalidii]
MERRNWVRLDNASNIFLAAKNDIDTKVFRLSAELEGTVNPRVLQRALDIVYKQYALYRSVLRRGLFWYYLEESNLRPVVRPETQSPCAPIYHFDRKELLFRVLYHQDRIHLEVFHALSDGTGAQWFFEDLVSEYISLMHLEPQSDGVEADPDRVTDQREDSFAKHFRKSRQKNFGKAALSALEKIYLERENDEPVKKTAVSSATMDEPDMIDDNQDQQTIYRIKGTKTPDNRTRVIELELPLDQMLKLAKSFEASLTVYLTALYLVAVEQTKEENAKSSALTISVPVNLRQYFPSSSARNFFTTVKLSASIADRARPDIQKLCRQLSEQLKAQTNQAYLEDRLNRFISFELNPFIRVQPRPLKDFILKIINRINNQKVTVAMSNLGRVVFPESVRPFIRAVYFHTSAIRPQFCMISHENQLTVSFTTPFVETEIQKRFVELLREEALPVTVRANKVTKEEMEGNANEPMPSLSDNSKR